jgi:hypothetical protein
VDWDARLLQHRAQSLSNSELPLSNSFIINKPSLLYKNNLFTKARAGTDEVRGYLLSREKGPAMAGELPTR